LKIPQKINLKSAKRSKKLPIILSREEIKSIINAIKNSNTSKTLKVKRTELHCYFPREN
jgi:site-specific recombinase XerD